jgi:hypothetical protein
MVVSIQAIATFQSLNDYLRPRVAAPPSLGGAASRLSAMYGAYASAAGLMGAGGGAGAGGGGSPAGRGAPGAGGQSTASLLSSLLNAAANGESLEDRLSKVKPEPTVPTEGTAPSDLEANIAASTSSASAPAAAESGASGSSKPEMGGRRRSARLSEKEAGDEEIPKEEEGESSEAGPSTSSAASALVAALAGASGLGTRDGEAGPEGEAALPPGGMAMEGIEAQMGMAEGEMMFDDGYDDEMYSDEYDEDVSLFFLYSLSDDPAWLTLCCSFQMFDDEMDDMPSRPSQGTVDLAVAAGLTSPPFLPFLDEVSRLTSALLLCF